LPDRLNHDGCEAIHLRRDQDDPTRIVSFTQWASRRHYEDYLAWRTDAELTDEIGELLTEPISIAYFDDIVTVTR
jgi:quinol monooxygenase YgiN